MVKSSQVALAGISLQDATVRKGGQIRLGPISCTVGQANCVAVLGPVGAGKTTLLRALYGLERLTSGHRQNRLERPHAMSFVFQHPVMLRRNVLDNVAYPLKLARIHFRSEHIQAELERFGLAEFAQASAQNLSGGQQQKLALLRALITQPELLFLDEPTTNMDEDTTNEIERCLEEAMAAGTRLILATHNMAQAARLASAHIQLHAGLIRKNSPQLA